MVSPDTVIEDIDNVTLEFIEVTITNPLDGELEILWVEDVTETSAPLDVAKHVTLYNFRPVQSYNETTATLRITGLDSVYEFQQVLRTLKYDNLADEPDDTTRVVQFTVSDGLLQTSGISSEIEITRINDSPFFNTTAVLIEPVIPEDLEDLRNPGWSVEEITTGVILDDDADSRVGIAIVEIDDSFGYWEITWDFSDTPPETPPTVGGSGSGSGLLQPGSGAFASGDFVSGLGSGEGSTSGSGGGSGADLASGLAAIGSAVMESGIFGSGSGSSSGSSSDSSSGSSSGSGSDFGFGSSSGSGLQPIITPTDPPPKCLQTTPTVQPPTTATFTATWYRLP